MADEASGQTDGQTDGQPDGSTKGRKSFLLRLDPAVHDALARWAADELRSTNAQIDFLLRAALGEAGRLPKDATRPRGRGRPRHPG